MGCCKGAFFLVDEPSFPRFFNIIQSRIYKPMVLATLSQGFPSLQQIPSEFRFGPDPIQAPLKPAFSSRPCHDRRRPFPQKPTQSVKEHRRQADPRVVRMTSDSYSRFSTDSIYEAERHIRRLQSSFGQLTPQLLVATAGLSHVKDFVGQLKQKLHTQ